MLERIFSFDTLWWILMIIYVPACIGLIVIVLLQKGKGTGFAGAFGAGAGPGSETVFGPRMSRSLPIRLTYISAALFMTIAIIMSLIAGQVGRGVAPELVQEDATAADTAGSPLSDYGLGTNRTDEARIEEAPPAPAPGEEHAETAAPAEAPAEAPTPAEAPAAAEESAEPVEETPAAEAPAAPEESPADTEPAAPEEAPVSQ